MLLRRGAPVGAVVDDGHTPLSVAIDNSEFSVARAILDYYRAHGQLQEAFEESFYDHEQKRFTPLLHRVCSAQGEELNSEAELLAMAQFLIEQDDEQTPANVALLSNRPMLHQYLRHVEDGKDGEEVEEVSNQNVAEDTGCWYKALFLLTSLPFLYFFATSKAKRGAGMTARVFRLCEKFYWVPFNIFLLY